MTITRYIVGVCKGTCDAVNAWLQRRDSCQET